MSSLSAARADNYYYPREWRPELGSINQFHKSHPLGKRAKDVANGVLVVRFEMPFNVWCAHCETHIGRGVRFNAKKKKCGMYFSTIRYEFVLTCAHCKGAMVIQTDPENRGYKLVSGVKQQTQGPDEDSGSANAPIEDTEPLNDPQVSMQLAVDPFFRLEHDKEDQRVAAKRARGLDALLELKDAHDKDNYSSNAALRAAFRSQKKQIQHRKDEANKLGLSIPLVDVHDDDVIASKAVVYKNIPGKRRVSAGSSREASCSRHTSTGKRSDDKAYARTHSKVSASTGKRAKADSFQYFGDAMGSHLHRLKMAKKSSAATTSLSKNRSERSSHGTSLVDRSSKLLRR
ncbi:C2c2-type zn-finger protein, partial [Globisporangium splendens]